MESLRFLVDKRIYPFLLFCFMLLLTFDTASDLKKERRRVSLIDEVLTIQGQLSRQTAISDTTGPSKTFKGAPKISLCDPLPPLPENLPVLCERVSTVGLGATGSTFLSYVLGKIGKEVGWKHGVVHDHSRVVSSYGLCTLTMVRDFRDILCSTLRRKENCMKCSPKALTAERNVLKRSFTHNFPETFLDDLYERREKGEISVVRYGNIFPTECALDFFKHWVPKYFGLESKISKERITELVNEYSIDAQQVRIEKEKARLRRKGIKITWKNAVKEESLSGNLHLNHISNNGMRNSWKACFTSKDKAWINGKLQKHLLRFNYSVEE